MSSLPSITAPLREFFTLARAEETARAYAPSQQASIRAYFDAGERRLSAGRRLENAIIAGALLREAVICYVIAAEIARDAGASERALSSETLASVMSELSPDASLPDVAPSDDTRVRMALAGGDDLLYFDRLPPTEAALMQSALDRAATMLRKRVEVRSVSNIRGARWGRVAAVALLLLYAVVGRIRALWLPANLALHKPVVASSEGYVPPAGQTIVDGDTGQNYGIHTQTEESPNVVIDLLGTYKIAQVKVHNRVDGWFDECLPLVAELSLDGKTFTEIGRREDHFDADPPWIVEAKNQPARFVRIRVARRGYLALSEVEVLGKKK